MSIIYLSLTGRGNYSLEQLARGEHTSQSIGASPPSVDQSRRDFSSLEAVASMKLLPLPSDKQFTLSELANGRHQGSGNSHRTKSYGIPNHLRDWSSLEVMAAGRKLLSVTDEQLTLEEFASDRHQDNGQRTGNYGPPLHLRDWSSLDALAVGRRLELAPAG